jgi:hypothetical protein
MQFAGHVLAAIAVPAGGSSCSVSIGASSAALTVTIPTADYFMTEDGGLDGLLATWQTQLNNNVQGYPQTAVAMGHVVPATWTAGWLLNITSGNDTGAFGGVTLTAGGAPGYVSGPKGGIDKAVQVTNAAAYFTGGTNFDVNATSDLAIAWVAKLDASATAARLVQKNSGGTGYWIVDFSATQVLIQVNDGVDTATAQAAAGSAYAGQWHVGIAVWDRSTNRLRIATAALDAATSFVSTETDASAVGSTGAGATFYVGNTHAGPTQLAALYIATGVGAATGLSANLATAIASFKSAINASWSASMSAADGRITVANSFWPSAVSFTNTTQRDVLGFEYDFDYPQTPAQMRAALGDRGTWTDGVGYLCNESSGNLASAFGAPATLTANGTPTYGSQGARGGADKAIGFDAAATEYFDGGNTRDVGASDDLLVVVVWKWSGYPSAYGSVVSKASGGFGNGWAILAMSDPWVAMFTGAGNANQVYAATNNSAFYKGQYCVAIGVVDRSTSRQRIGVINLATGATSISSELAVSGSFSNASSFRLGKSDWINAPTDCQLSAVYVATGAGVATGVSANMASALSSFRSYMLGQTGTKQCRGVWFPECPVFVAESDPRLAPVRSDARTSVSGSGDRITHVGVYQRYHRVVRWSHVPISRIREQSATYANASFRTFWDDTQLARGSIPWFYPGSSLCIVDHNGNVLGQDMQTGGPTEGWGVDDPGAVEPKRVDPNGNDQRWLIEIAQLIAKDE